ncbi:transcription repressor HrcA [Winkia neuii]|nr:transcription repressor HrcA [Winkia neuii]
MENMGRSRRDQVLGAIVSAYVNNREPVGSKALVERYNLGVSSATIRNDMAALEEAGYIYQPHTSAGRVPTDKGYRAFVDQIASLKPLSAPERQAIEKMLAGAVDIDDVMERTVRVLAQLTHQVAVVQYPSMQGDKLRHLEIVPLASRYVLLVIITESGRVEQHPLEVPAEVDPAGLNEVATWINQTFAGRGPKELVKGKDLLATLAPGVAGLATLVLDALTVALPTAEDRIVMAGTANLARSGTDFVHSIGPVLDALEEQVALLRLFAEMGGGSVAVSIGAENRHDGLSEASVISGTYGNNDGLSAHVGVVGPTRMDYPGTMRSVGAIARYLTHFLSN